MTACDTDNGPSPGDHALAWLVILCLAAVAAWAVMNGSAPR